MADRECRVVLWVDPNRMYAHGPQLIGAWQPAPDGSAEPLVAAAMDATTEGMGGWTDENGTQWWLDGALVCAISVEYRDHQPPEQHRASALGVEEE